MMPQNFKSAAATCSSEHVLCLLYMLLFPATGLSTKSEGVSLHQSASYSASSVLSSGQWLKIAVTADGIYRIDYSLLRKKGLSDLSNPRIFGNNAGQLSYYNDGTGADDLREIPVYINAGSDGIFNEGDYLLFYGTGTHRWEYDQSSGEYYFHRHNYSDTAYYFITPGATPGKRITQYAEPSSPHGYNSAASDAFFCHELENVNLIKSGRDWFQKVASNTGVKVNPGFPDLIVPDGVRISVRVAARSASPTEFDILESAVRQTGIKVPKVDVFNTTGIFAAIKDSAWLMNISSASPSFEVKFNNKGNASASGWLDYIRVQGRVRNVFKSQFTTYMDSRSVAPGLVTAFSIESNNDNVMVWDVTDPFNIKSVSYRKEGKNMTFRSETDSLKKFVAFLVSNARVPEIHGSYVQNQNLHASHNAEMVIITHPLFRKYAEELADIHLQNSGLTSLVVTTGQVYNEFSGGIPDIAALRNFVRMKFIKQKGTSMPLRYLLLFGDGSFDNKTLPPGNPNFIPTYQSENSNVVVSSFTSDDFYGLLEDGEGEADGTEDIGIGRLPVNDTTQARIIINKIRNYLDPASMGNWKNVITLVADDEDGNAHMADAEGLEQVLKEQAPEYNIEKIYLDAFRQVTSVNGQSYPDATNAINERINKGCLIFNYTGHGNESFLASEKVITNEDFRSWKNGGRLPLFITATCEFSRFDDVETGVMGERTEKTSAGETILFSAGGGAIALMSTTRIVFSAPNFFLNRDIFTSAFGRDTTGNPMRLGDIIRIAKNKSGSGANKRNFSLLGDPALRLGYPWHGKVVTDSINHVPVTSGIDSLKALSLITVSGHITDNKNETMKDFNGVVSPVVYDKESRIRTLANDGGPSMEFGMRNNIIFNGQTRAKNGEFSFSFIVPRDIDYSFGSGKISYYAHDGARDMNGSFTDVVVGGFSNVSTVDTTGPVIKLYMNDTLFRRGGITGENPVLLALLEDPGGINTTGAGIGHDLTGFLDNDRNRSFVLNNYYVNDFDDYKKGRITYNFSGLERGTHSFTLKAWDNFNNSSEETIVFVVESGGKFILKNLINYPNPLRYTTTFRGELNRTDETLEITIDIYSLNGKLIRRLTHKTLATGYVLPVITWDGMDDGGNRVSAGLYPYLVLVKTGKGEIARASGKMIIMRE